MKVAIFLVFCFVGAALGQERRCPANMIQLFNGVACSSDSMCYTMAPGYFCLNGYCCANSACKFLILCPALLDPNSD